MAKSYNKCSTSFLEQKRWKQEVKQYKQGAVVMEAIESKTTSCKASRNNHEDSTKPFQKREAS
jgi:hypothetical protein